MSRPPHALQPTTEPAILRRAPRADRRWRRCGDPGQCSGRAVRRRRVRRRPALKLRSFARVQLVGELVNLRPSRARCTSSCATPPARSRAPPGARTGRRWSARAGKPARRGHAGRGGRRLRLLPRQRDLLPRLLLRGRRPARGRRGRPARPHRPPAQAARRRGPARAQKRLALPLLPRTIGVITGQEGKARDDVLAALARRGWAGRLVWAFAPVQDRHAAPAIVRALGDLAAVAEVEVVIVARGGGSLADLLCFCDETLCRTVALLGVPVIASVGHHTDRTLLDDVAAVSCSTPTHAAEAAVGVDCRRARAEQTLAAARGCATTAGGPCSRARAAALDALARARRAPGPSARTPAPAAARGPRRLTPADRVRAAPDRAARARAPAQGRLFPARLPPATTARAAATRARAGRARSPAHARARLRPRQSADEQPLLTAAQARRAGELRLRFADDTLPAQVIER